MKEGQGVALGAGEEIHLQPLEKTTVEHVGIWWRNCASGEPTLEPLLKDRSLWEIATPKQVCPEELQLMGGIPH